MRPLRLLTVSVAICGLIGASTAIADPANSVIVINNTSYTLVEFYASSSDSPGWDLNLNMLAGHTLPPGGHMTVPLTFQGGDEGNCMYDFMGVLDGASQAAYQYEVNGCTGDTWTITP